MLFESLAVPLLAVATPATAPESAQPPLAIATLAAEPPAPASAPPPSPAPVIPPEPVADAPSPGTTKDIVVSARTPSPKDPAEELNVASYEVVQKVDEAVIAPITHSYMTGVPKPLQDGLHNVLTNLDEPVVFANFLLQVKPGKALETLGRFVINSTFGLAGLFDVAKRKPFNLPRRRNGLAYTLGYYGVGPGPYLFLPLIGPTTVRDLAGRLVDLAVLPTAVPKVFGDPIVALGKGVISSLDSRAQDDARLVGLNNAPDPYVAHREEYLARRQAEIDVLKGKRKSIDDPPYYRMPAPVDPAADTPPAPLPVPQAGPAPATGPLAAPAGAGPQP